MNTGKQTRNCVGLYLLIKQLKFLLPSGMELTVSFISLLSMKSIIKRCKYVMKAAVMMFFCFVFVFNPCSCPVPSQSPTDGQRGVWQRWEAQSGRAESAPNQGRPCGGSSGLEAHRRGRYNLACREEPAGHRGPCDRSVVSFSTLCLSSESSLNNDSISQLTENLSTNILIINYFV